MYISYLTPTLCKTRSIVRFHMIFFPCETGSILHHSLLSLRNDIYCCMISHEFLIYCVLKH